MISIDHNMCKLSQLNIHMQMWTYEKASNQ